MCLCTQQIKIVMFCLANTTFSQTIYHFSRVLVSNLMFLEKENHEENILHFSASVFLWEFTFNFKRVVSSIKMFFDVADQIASCD